MTGRPAPDPAPDPEPAADPAASSAPDDRHDAVASRRILTVPNVLSFSRILGSVVLIWLAWIGAEGWFIGVFLGFLFTDWLDGKLAVALHQRTILGARLDTVGDGILYLCLLLGVPLLEPDFLARDWPLVTLMLVSHFAAAGASVIKFRRIPAYHTRAAKTCWLLICIGTVTLLAGGPAWPARLALAAVVLTNLQSIAMTMTLPRWEADVSSWWHARRIARQAAETP